MVYHGLSPVRIILNTPTVNLGLSPESTTLDLPMWSISVHRQYEHFSIRQQFVSVYRQFVFLSGACATTDAERTYCQEFTLIRTIRTTPDMPNDLSRFITSAHNSRFASGLSLFIASMFF